EQLMISEALHRGETVFNIALRLDPNSVMRAAAFQLIRNVLHGAGTVIALRPEDSAAAASVEIVEAALSSQHGEAHLRQRCHIPAIVSGARIERADAANSPEHELIGELLKAQAAQLSTSAAEKEETANPAQSGGPGSAVAAVAENTLRVAASR